LYWFLGSRFFLSILDEMPALVDAWLDARATAELRRIETVADAELFPVVIVSDDIVTKSGIFFSTEWIQVHWIPKLKQVVDAWHERQTIVIFRSEGNLMPYLDDLTSTGIDGLSPLEGMPISTIRDQYKHLVLAGGIDTAQLLAYAMPGEVRKVCRDTIIAAARRGYFLGSSGTVNFEAQVENVVAMYESSGSRADRPAPPKRRF
jgi:uroporphyrinogen-III decarboxylase